MSASTSTIESVLVENRVFPPPAACEQAARVSGMAGYEALCAEAERDFEGFWARLARENVQWTKPFTRTLDESNAPFFQWFADDETLAAMEMEPYELTGLYHGSPVGEKSMFDGMRLPDRIHLYRQPLLAEWCETGVDLRDLIAHVVVHEVGHHFGLSDDDMHALEDAV